VRQLSEAQQTPEFLYRSGGEAETVLPSLPLPTKRDLTADLGTLTVRLDNTEPTVRLALKSNLQGVRLVEAGTADLIWDAKDRVVLSGTGDRVAERVGVANLQGVINKWRVLPAIKDLVQARPLAVSLSPSDARHADGKPIAFRVSSTPHKFLTILNIAADGTVQFLYPRADNKDPPGGERDVGHPFSIDLAAGKPFGADHAIFISSASSLHVLHQKLNAPVNVVDLPILLKEALGSGTYFIGLQGLYTEARKP
jgi:hypothetical protein